MLKLNLAFALLDEKLIFSFCGKAPAGSYITERHLRGVLRLFREITNYT